jgi:glucose-6-phosphate isomerase
MDLEMRQVNGFASAPSSLMERGLKAYAELKEKKRPADSLGWVSPNAWVTEEALSHIEEVAGEIRKKAEVLLLIGIGGSNQGARAVIDGLGNPSSCKVIWAGNTLSSWEYERTLKELEGKDFCIDVIAKNFETLEPGVAFRVFRKELERRYGKAANRYIYTTGTRGSHLEGLSQKEGYTFLSFPTDIGGRYSIFSDVGLLPIAVAGLSIRNLAKGAGDEAEEIDKDPASLVRYAAMRNDLYGKGYRIEMESFYEPRLFRFAKWWTQLMAESEGKDGKGIYPVIGSYSEDLHSVGQFVQDGSPIIFEHFIKVTGQDSAIALPDDGIDDRFSYVSGKTLWEVNRTSQEATIRAHAERLPVFTIEIEKISEYELGRLFYYFMTACAVSGRILGIDPFDQPGVEAYKKLMFENLGKGERV